MDLKSFRPLYGDEPIWINLRDPFGVPIDGDDGKPVQLHVLSPESGEYTRRVEAIHRAHRERFKESEPSDEDVKAYAIARLAAALMGWSSNFTIDGERPVFSEDKARELVGDPELAFIRTELALWTASPGKAWAALQKPRGDGENGEAASTDAKVKQSEPAEKN